MDQIKYLLDIIKVIMNGIKSPIKAGLGAFFALFLYLFISIKKGDFRDKKSEREKEDQKDETNTDLENSNAQADSSIRSRLKRPMPNDI